MNRIFRDSLNIAKILSRIYHTNDGIFVDSSTNMKDERVFLGVGDLLWRSYWDIEMKLGTYAHINVGTLMSIGNDRQ